MFLLGGSSSDLVSLVLVQLAAGYRQISLPEGVRKRKAVRLLVQTARVVRKEKTNEMPELSMWKRVRVCCLHLQEA